MNKIDIVRMCSIPHEKALTLFVEGARFDEFKALLNRALNTHDQAPRWMFDMADSMEEIQIEKTKGMR